LKLQYRNEVKRQVPIPPYINSMRLAKENTPSLSSKGIRLGTELLGNQNNTSRYEDGQTLGDEVSQTVLALIFNENSPFLVRDLCYIVIRKAL
jgi:hypothetical protein